MSDPFAVPRPCANCPFRKDCGSSYGLSSERLREIADADAFPCHKTHYSSSARTKTCAGWVTLQHRSGNSPQIMQIAERLLNADMGSYDPDNQVYENWDDAIAGHRKVT